MIPIAVFASGRGSNFSAIVRAISDGRLDARVSALVCDRPDAAVLSLAREAGVRAIVIEPSAKHGIDERRRHHEEQILDSLKPLEPKFLVMAGYMRVLTSRLIEAFRSERGYARIVNIHPSLLPAFPGVGSYGQAFHHGAKLAGVTVHLVEEALDSGPICAQESFPIDQCTDAADVERLGLAVEHRLYPETLQWILKEKFAVVRSANGRLCVSKN